jgi:hypothetical protein
MPLRELYVGVFYIRNLGGHENEVHMVHPRGSSLLSSAMKGNRGNQGQHLPPGISNKRVISTRSLLWLETKCSLATSSIDGIVTKFHFLLWLPPLSHQAFDDHKLPRTVRPHAKSSTHPLAAPFNTLMKISKFHIIISDFDLAHSCLHKVVKIW